MFRITYFFWRAVFLEQLLFQKTLPSVTATFFRRVSYGYSYGFFPRCTSYLFVGNQVNSVPAKWSLSAVVLSCVSIIAHSITHCS